MPYLTFTFENTNEDQTFSFDDEIDSSQNPHVVGPINSSESSAKLTCWAGGDGEGKITVTGSVSGALYQEIKYNDYFFRF